jgi:cbb3-type cytochrome oxidase maturation protein
MHPLLWPSVARGADMESLYFLIPLSLLVLLAAIGLLVWAVNSGQYDDIEREAERILQDDELPPPDPQARPDATVESAGQEGAGRQGEHRQAGGAQCDD